MKLPNLLPKKQKKLRATTATSLRALPAHAGEEEQEPTMRLSSAFIVVVILHLVAVGGIYTFESIKAHRAPETAALEAEAAEVSPLPMLARTEGDQPNPASNTSTQRVAAQPTVAPKREVKKEVAQPVAAKPTATKPKAASSGGAEKIHIVQKGENPVTIARKYGIDQDALLKLNNISDPRRLQINQKLRIPQP